jgi:hypothetical protein
VVNGGSNGTEPDDGEILLDDVEGGGNVYSNEKLDGVGEGGGAPYRPFLYKCGSVAAGRLLQNYVRLR